MNRNQATMRNRFAVLCISVLCTGLHSACVQAQQGIQHIRGAKKTRTRGGYSHLSTRNEDESFWSRFLQNHGDSLGPSPSPVHDLPTVSPVLPAPVTPGPVSVAPSPAPIPIPPSGNLTASLEVDVSSPGSAFTNQFFEYTVTVENTGAATATNTFLTVGLPNDGTFVSSEPAGDLSSNNTTLAVSLGDIQPNSSVATIISVQSPIVNTTMTVTATASADNTDESVSEEETVDVGVSSIVLGGVTSAGVGLRNRAEGNIPITEIPSGATVTRAVLVWAILYEPNDGVPSNQITFEGTRITANLEATISKSLCWGDDDITIGYAADVTNLVSNENRDYVITDPVNGLVNNSSDPLGLLPYTDGASLFVFYRGPGISNQVLFDFTYSASEGSEPLGRSISGINSVGGEATLHIAGPDGQNNAGEAISLLTSAGFVNFTDIWSGTAPISGPDFTIGNLWDNQIFDVTSILPAGETSFEVLFEPLGDCIGISGVALEVAQ